MLKVPSGASAPESQTMVSLVVVWAIGSVFVHVIDCPAEMVIVAGCEGELGDADRHRLTLRSRGNWRGCLYGGFRLGGWRCGLRRAAGNGTDPAWTTILRGALPTGIAGGHRVAVRSTIDTSFDFSLVT